MDVRFLVRRQDRGFASLPITGSLARQCPAVTLGHKPSSRNSLSRQVRVKPELIVSAILRFEYARKVYIAAVSQLLAHARRQLTTPRAVLLRGPLRHRATPANMKERTR